MKLIIVNILKLGIINLFHSFCLSDQPVGWVAPVINDPIEINKQRIDNYIRNLKYDRDSVLISSGETVTIAKKIEADTDERGTFVVVRRQLRKIENSDSNIGVTAASQHRTFPGSALLANGRLVDNTPDILALERAPMKFTIDLPGLEEEGSFVIIPTYGNYKTALNRVLKIWHEKYEKDYHLSAIIQSDSSLAYSKEQLRVKFGVEFRNLAIESNIDFGEISSQKKCIMIQRFKQIFFTVSVETPSRPANFFSPNVSVEELAQLTNDQNPPVIVDSVSYGRTIYVKIETSSTDTEARTALESEIILNGGTSNSANYSQNLENLNFQVYVIGGDSDHINLINVKTMQEVDDTIVKYGSLSRTNPGFPVSYSAQFLKDSSKAIVMSTTQYVDTTTSKHKMGLIQLVHKGWFIAKFQITWSKKTYVEGKLIRTIKTWPHNDEELTAPYQTEIKLDGSCDNIEIKIDIATGLAWEWWRTVLTRTALPLLDNRMVRVWGTTFKTYTYID